MIEDEDQRVREQKLVFNIMLGCGLGGIEQAFLDYDLVLKQIGYKVINIIHPKAKIRSSLDAKNNQYLTLTNWGIYDLLAVYRLRRMIARHHPSYIVTHGNRSAVLARMASYRIANRPTLISVSHNYSYRRLLSTDYIIATTEHMRQAIIKDGYNLSKVFRLPNMIVLPESPDDDLGDEAGVNSLIKVIGAMGRFEKKKGFDLLLQAIAVLRDRGIECRLNLGGDGKISTELKSLVQDLKLEDWVTFTGWVKDKNRFFMQCDVFCIPSLHEPFGIIMLEAFANKVPVVCTKTEGPSEIARHGEEAEMVLPGSVPALVESLQCLLQDQIYAKQLVTNAYDRLCQTYSMQVVAKQFEQIFELIEAHKKLDAY